MSAAWWQRLQQVAGTYKVATLPLAIAGSGVSAAKLYSYWNPQGYMQWYLYSISAGKFNEPHHEGPWVENKAMARIVKEALEPHPDQEEMTLLSGFQTWGKTSAVLKECHKQSRVGFFVDLGIHTGENTVEKLTTFIAKSLIANNFSAPMEHSFYQLAKRLFFPLPDPKYVWEGLHGVFQKHAKENLVVVMDETQMVANERVRHDGVLNHLCIVSRFGSVVLIGSSEYAVPQFLQKMTHIAKRTTVVYATAPTAEEMLPHVQERFGKTLDPEKVVEAFAGSFELLRQLDKPQAGGVDGVKKWLKVQLENQLELTVGGMTNQTKATSTGQAMVAAAQLAFGDTPLEASDKNTLELAQVGAVKIETVEGYQMKASWATPCTEEIMKELLCDSLVHTVMEERVPTDLYDKFQKAIKGRCPAAPAKN